MLETTPPSRAKFRGDGSVVIRPPRHPANGRTRTLPGHNQTVVSTLRCLNFGLAIANWLSQLFSWEFAKDRGKNRGKPPSASYHVSQLTDRKRTRLNSSHI